MARRPHALKEKLVLSKLGDHNIPRPQESTTPVLEVHSMCNQTRYPRSSQTLVDRKLHWFVVLALRVCLEYLNILA